VKTVADVLREKGGTVHSIGPNATVYEALELMARQNIGAALVVEGERLAGIVSERDCVRKLELRGRSARDTRVGEIMTGSVFYVQPEQTIEECMGLMTSHRIRHLPVLQEGRIRGVVSIGDVVKAYIAEQGFLIEQLTNYITGKGR
jgi:CBS domain-containing protein